MRTTTCPSAADLAAFNDGELPGATLDAIAAHLEQCAACDRAVQALDDLSDPIVAVLRQFPQPSRVTGGSTGPGAGGDATVAGVNRVTEALAPPPIPRRLGDFEVLEELGRGGMGVVYKGWHPALKRFVALKVIRAGEYASAEEAIRFRREAETVARVRHPNLVQIYEVGQQDGLPYLVLEYVAGGGLDRYLAGQPQPAAAAARLVATLAEAVDAAHRQGVVHRDLKPANILLTGGGPPAPKITDFGLAKQLDGVPAATGTGVVAGTPSYMAPEQAAGRAAAVGPTTDVYALGAILYEMLVGHPPFRGESTTDTLLQVLHHDPVPPSRLRPRVPRDLETVCLKCLQKDPQRRYPTARALADDLGRFLADQPVLARRAGPAERVVRWCRRNPLPAALAALVLLTVGLGTTAVAFFAVEAHASATQAAANAEAADANAEAADANAVRAGRNEQRALGEKALADAAREETQQNLYYAEMHLAGQARPTNRALTRVTALLDRWRPAAGRPDPRGWEWYYLDALSRQDLVRLVHDGGVLDVAWDPAGARVATVGNDRHVRVWAADTGALLLTVPRPADRPAAARCVAWSPDGARLATGEFDGVVHLWDAATGAWRRSLAGHAGEVIAVSFAPDGKRLGSVGLGDGTARLRDLAGDGETQVIRLAMTGLHNAAWDKAWTRLAVGGREGARVFDLARKSPPVTVEGTAGNVSWSPDGRRLALSQPDLTLRVIDAATGKSVRTLRGARHWVTATAWTPDSRTLCSVGLDHAVRFWDADEGRLLHTALGHTDELFAVAWCPRGDRLATAGRDGAVRVWRDRGPTVPVAATLRSVSWNGDDTRLAVAAGSSVHVLDRRTLREVSPPGGYPIRATAVAWAPTGDRLACPSVEGAVRIVDGGTGQVLRTLPEPPGAVRAAAWSPDGTRLATAAPDAVVRVWDVAAGKVVRTYRAAGPEVPAVAWSPDGKRLAAGGRGRAWVWDVGGTAVAELAHPDGRVDRLAWSPDGKQLAAGDTAGKVTVWDVAARRAVRVMRGGHDFIRGLAWSPDGRRLASATIGTGVLVWDAATGQQAYAGDVEGNLADLAWSPDGTALAGVSMSDGTLVLWDAAASYHYHKTPDRLHWTHAVERLDPLLAQGRPAEALALLRLALAAAPDNPALRRRAADVSRRAGDRLRADGQPAEADAAHAQARTRYEQMLASTPTDRPTLRALADLLLDGAARWHTLAPTRLASAGGATLTVQPDGSVLATGTNPAKDAYEIAAPTALAEVAAVRLEALPDPRLPHGGSGRYPGNGNFQLSTLALAVGPSGRPAAVPLTGAAADYTHPHSAAGNVVDDRPETTWDSFPRHREPRRLVARAHPPAVAGPGATVVVSLDFRNRSWDQHGLGRFRLALTDDPRGYLGELVRGQAADATRLAAAYLLAGDARAAARWLPAAPDPATAGGARDGLLLALAHHALGATAEARGWYDRAAARLRQHPADLLLSELAVEATVRVVGVPRAAARVRVEAWQAEAAAPGPVP